MKAYTKKRRLFRKVTIIIAVTLISYVVLSMSASVVIFQIIFSRSDVVNSFELTYDDIDQVKYPREEVYFYSGNNRLYGCVYRAKGKAEGLVLLANGMRCRADRHLPEIMYFIDYGFSVMTYENTGVGNSEGAGTVGIAQARLDADAAIEYIKSNSGLSSLPLMLYGHSIGGYAVTAALKDEESICAVVSVSGFNSPNENMLCYAKRYVGVLADLQYPFMCMQNYFLFGSICDDTALEAINSTDKPVMIINGGSDDVVTEDISILGKSDKITNPNAVTLEIDEPYRGEHSTVWLSRDSAEYLMTDENPVDKSRANVLDEDYMAGIIEFYRNSVKLIK